MGKWPSCNTSAERRVLRELLAQRDGCHCVWCGHQFPIPNHASIEHLVPKGDGGTDDPENLRLACRECNNDRQTWFAIAKGEVRSGRQRFYSQKARKYVGRERFARGLTI